MPTYKTAKKVSKWRHAHERCLTWSFRIPGAKCRRRVSKKKLDRVHKLMNYWGKKIALVDGIGDTPPFTTLTRKSVVKSLNISTKNQNFR